MSNCNDCGIVKTLENTYLVKPKTGSSYLRSRCNSCHSAKQRTYNEVNKVAVNQKSRDWRKTNPDRHNYLTTKYKEHVKKATPSWLTNGQLEEIAYKYFMAKEARIMTGEEYHVDHIVPLRGKNISGLHVPWNLQVLPSDMNLSKSNKWTVV